MPPQPQPVPVSAEALFRHAYGMRDAPPDSQAGKVVRGAKIVGGGLLLGMTMLGGLYLSRKISEWKKPAKEREPVEFLTFDWETIITVSLAVAVGAGFTWLVMRWVRAEQQDDAAKQQQQVIATLAPPAALPPPMGPGAPSADPIDQMMAELQQDDGGSSASAPAPAVAPVPEIATIPALGI